MNASPEDGAKNFMAVVGVLALLLLAIAATIWLVVRFINEFVEHLSCTPSESLTAAELSALLPEIDAVRKKHRRKSTDGRPLDISQGARYIFAFYRGELLSFLRYRVEDGELLIDELASGSGFSYMRMVLTGMLAELCHAAELKQLRGLKAMVPRGDSRALRILKSAFGMMPADVEEPSLHEQIREGFGLMPLRNRKGDLWYHMPRKDFEELLAVLEEEDLRF